MEVLEEYPAQIEHSQHHAPTAKVLNWGSRTFSGLGPSIVGNQLMFTLEG